jgi:PAS domain S-box-containing protein
MSELPPDLVRAALTAPSRAERDELARLLDNLPRAFVYQVFVAPDGTRHFVYVSAGVERLLGITPADVYADAGALYRQIHEEDAPRVSEREAEALRTLSRFSMEARFRAPSGEIRSMLLSSAPRALPGGAVVWDGAAVDLTDRRQAEQALLASEARFRMLFEAAADAIFVHDERGRILDANRAACTRLGYSREELLSMTVPDIESGTRPEVLPELWEQIRAGRALSTEGVHRRRDGSTFPVELHVQALSFGASGLVFFATARDVSERKAAEQALRLSERRLSLAISATADAVWEWNLVTNETYYSPRWYEMLGYGDQAFPMTFEAWKGLCHPEDFEPAVALIQRTLSARHSTGYDAEFRMRAASGSWLWIRGRGNVVERDAEGRPVLLSGTNTDITQHKQAELETEEWRERYELLTRAAGHVVYDRDANGSVVWGGVIQDMLGYGAEELSGGREEWQARIHPEDRERVVEAYRSAEAEGRAFSTEYRFRHRAGHYVLVRDSGYPSTPRDAGSGAPAAHASRYIGVLADITAAKAEEQHRARLEESLRQAQKMESIGRLAGGIAHDFNNLLTAISGNTSLALLEAAAGSPQRELLQEVKQAAESAARLTTQLLTFSRKQVIDPQSVDLNESVGQLEGMLKRLLGEDIRVAVLLEAKHPWVTIDVSQAEQIIINLALNARDAMPSGGELTIETSNVSLDEAFCGRHAGVQPGPHVRIAVSDSGAGMTEAVRGQIFEPFFTTKPGGKGTGLGLAMVYGAIKQNGGAIEVYSEPGRGTTFKLYLRCAAAAASSPRVSVPHGLPRGTETIALVEDEDVVRAFAVRLLTRQGYRVLAFSNGEQALTALAESSEPVHLMLTDVVMPGMNGRELARRIQAVRPSLRVLFSSGYTENVIVQHGVLEPGIAFIAKPYSTESLTARIRELLDGPDPRDSGAPKSH